MITCKIKIKEGSEEKELEITIDNVDFLVVDSLIEAFHFKDANSFFKFAIGALLEVNNHDGMYTMKKSGSGKVPLPIEPADDLLKPKSE